MLITACARLPGPGSGETTLPSDPSLKEMEVVIAGPCSRAEAEQWASDALEEVTVQMKAANCYAFLAETGKDGGVRLSDAQAGRRLAEKAAQRVPESALAHYLNAYLTGLEAENDPLHGLSWVPVIEREALLASKLDPYIHHGGPHRMLGELYLRAPGVPISIGDVEKAVAHYRLAVTQAPDFAPNRLGLIEALLKAQEIREACIELHALLTGMPPSGGTRSEWEKAMELLKRLCAGPSPGH